MVRDTNPKMCQTCFQSRLIHDSACILSPTYGFELPVAEPKFNTETESLVVKSGHTGQKELRLSVKG